ncbi:hypothetical protein K1719_011934 [Acacia pycnantha]|nr:hypothetical protein K1719_011934 [Acacia pycnantha]
MTRWGCWIYCRSKAFCCNMCKDPKLGLGHAGGEVVSTIVKAFIELRDFLVKSFSEMEGVKILEPQGAFYVFTDVSWYYGRQAQEFDLIEDSESFCRYLLNKAQVAIVPGGAFGDNNCICVSYSSSLTILQEVVERIKRSLVPLTTQALVSSH